MPSGRPDWFGTIVAAGKYDTTYIPIALDVDGFITATIKGAYDAVLKTIAVDNSGVMKANLSVQDLDFLTVRPAYGEAVHLEPSTIIPTGVETSLSTVSGRGVLYTANFRWATASASIDMLPILKVDGSIIVDETMDLLYRRDLFHPDQHSVFIIKYDNDNFSYIVGFRPGITFESSLEFKGSHTFGSDVLVYLKYVYALVPG